MSEVNESGAQVDAKAETSASMSESRRSDEDVIEFDDQVLGPQVVTSSETGRLARDDTNLRRRKPPFQQGIEVPEYEPGNQTLNPPPKSPEGGEAEGDDRCGLRGVVTGRPVARDVRTRGTRRATASEISRD